MTTYTDENGSIFSNMFDPLGRKTVVGISTVLGGTTDQSFEFDGLSRITRAVDTAGSDVEVDLIYDSLSRLIEESETS